MICEFDKCTGCHACYNVCPRNAIKMIEDEEGFLIPKIDEKLCIHCNLCKKVCPVLEKDKEESNRLPIYTYAAYNKDKQKVLNSSSGGIFSILLERIIQNRRICLWLCI